MSSTTNEEGKNHFEMLPDVALIEILSYLHATEVDKMTKLSRRFCDLSLTRTAARNVNLSRCHNCSWNWMLDYLKTLSAADVMTGALDLSHNLWIPAKSLEKLTNVMNNVTCLDITGCCISGQCMQKILSKATKLHTLAFTDRAFNFSSPQAEGDPHERSLNEDSLCTLARLTHLSITFLTCSKDLSLVAYCPQLTALRLDQHLNTMRKNCICTLQNLTTEHFRHLKKYSQTAVHSHVHPEVTTFMKNVLKHLLLNRTKFTKLFAPFTSLTENASVTQSMMDEKPHWTSSLSHTDAPVDMKETVPSLRYLKTDIVRLKNVEDHIFKQFPNLQYLCLCQRTSEEVENLIVELLPHLASACPHILGLCISGIHVHQTTKDSLVAQILGRLKKLQYLSISPCAFEARTQETHSIFDTEDDIAEKTSKSSLLPNGVENSSEELGKDISGLVQACRGLTELELIYPHTRVCLRYPLDGSSDARSECCRGVSEGMVPTDATFSALGHLKYLQRLTLGGVLGVRHGTGFTTIFRECWQLSYLSLADFGLRGQCLWMPAFCDALKYAASLQDLRIEHKNLDTSTRLLSSLQGCPKLRRLCLISEKGRIEQPSSFIHLIESSKDLSLLVVCTADSVGVRRKLRVDTKKRFKEIRPALSVVFGSSEELKSQEGQQETLKSVPNIDLGELVLFKYHVCSPERHDGIT